MHFGGRFCSWRWASSCDRRIASRPTTRLKTSSRKSDWDIRFSSLWDSHVLAHKRSPRAWCWAAFAMYPAPLADFNFPAVGVPAQWPHHVTGFASHWDKNSNLAHSVDVWFLNLFPREKPFAFNGGGYLTLNFVPSLATMIFGLLAGGWLRKRGRLQPMFLAGAAGIAAGIALDSSGVCPMVKRIWTPSWTLFAGGCTTLILAAVYWLVDVKQWRGWTFPFLVVGMNSIAMYVMVHLMDGFLADSLKIHLGRGIFETFGKQWALVAQGAMVLVILWCICLWMYRRKLFLRV